MSQWEKYSDKFSKLLKIGDYRPTAINKYKDIDDDQYISFEEMTKIPFNTPIDIDEKDLGSITTTRLASEENQLLFRVKMKAGKLWKTHYHNCIEMCVVLEGELLDLISQRRAGKHKTIVFKAGKEGIHNVRAERDSVFYVKFLQ